MQIYKFIVRLTNSVFFGNEFFLLYICGMEYLLIGIICLLLIIGLRVERLRDAIEDMIANGVKDEFDIHYSIPDESVKKIASLVLDEIEERKKEQER